MLTCATCGGLTPDAASPASPTCLHCEAQLAAPAGPPRWALRLTALLGPAGAILLAACYGGPGRYHLDRPVGPGGATRVDRDGDGDPGPWTCEYSGPGCAAELDKHPAPPDVDCDDNDQTRYHGAADKDGDGIDQNCDGVDGWKDEAQVATPPPEGASAPATPAAP